MRIDETDSVTEPELLMEVMEIREALEEAQSEEQVDQIRQDNEGHPPFLPHRRSTPSAFPTPPADAFPFAPTDKIAAVGRSLSAAFGSSPPDLALAKDLLIHWKYLENIEGVCREWAPGRPIQIQH